MTFDQEAAISIVHHGRDRTRLLPCVYEGHRADFGNLIPPWEEYSIAVKGLKATARLTPKNDTKVAASSILRYVDISKVLNEDFIYTYDDIQEAVSELWAKDPALDPAAKTWLLGRGVTEQQLHMFRSFDQIQDYRRRVCLGVQIHPALESWIGHSVPAGVAYPGVGKGGKMVGCHLRFLSTVPKVKFGASCPLVHISSNVFTADCRNGVWLVEGLFDGLALDRLGLAYAAPSSGAWSSEQLGALISFLREKKPPVVYLAHDRDRVGAKENLILFSLLSEEFNVRLFLYPEGIKDMSELVCKHRLDPRRIEPVSVEHLVRFYLSLPYQSLVDFDIYLDHRNTAYSNDRYNWVQS